MTLLFCVAAGPRLGYGHLARAVSVAQWLGTSATCSVAIRGGAGRFPFVEQKLELVQGTVARLLSGGGWDGVVIDDPHADAAARLVRTARAAGLRVASFHDLGLAPLPSDLAVDGSLVQASDGSQGQASTLPAARILVGPRYMVLDPSLGALAQGRASNPPHERRVVMSLGGGESSQYAVSLATMLGRMCPDLEILVTTAFSNRRGASLDLALNGSLGAGVHVLAADIRLRELLSTAAVAVTSAGVTAYEAVALGVPAIPVAVVRSQQPTCRAFVKQGLVVATRMHAVWHREWRERAVRDVVGAFRGGADCSAVTRRARLVLDTQGGARVARELRRLFGAHRGHSRE